MHVLIRATHILGREKLRTSDPRVLESDTKIQKLCLQHSLLVCPIACCALIAPKARIRVQLEVPHSRERTTRHF